MKILFILLFTLMIICNSCRNTETPIDGFFEALEKSIDKNNLMQFKDAPKDSALFYFKRFENEFYKIYNDSSQTVVLNDFFNSIHLGKNTENRLYYLCFAFHSKLNHKEFNNDEIMQDRNKEFLKIEAKWDEKEKLFELEQHKIMQTNNKKWSIGNIINITLPVKFENGIKSARYCQNHPTRMDCSNFDDSLKINGRLIQKKYDTYLDSNKIDTTEIRFELIILKLSNPRYKIFDEKYVVGDTLNLYLSAYGKLIN